MKRVVVTGASSFIGAYLIQELLKDTENEIYAVIRPNSSNRDRVPQDDRVKIVELDMAQIEELPSYVPGQVEGFYHLAWNGTRGETRDDEKKQKENYEASLLAAKTAEKLQAKMFLGSGSQAEYGIVKEVVSEADEAKPTTAYGKMKKQTYDALKEYFANTSVKLYWVRIFSVFGPEDYEGTLIMSSLDKMQKNEPLQLTECIQKWDYIYIRDVADALGRLFGRTGRSRHLQCGIRPGATIERICAGNERNFTFGVRNSIWCGALWPGRSGKSLPGCQ